ncbi:glutamate-1-semialdehyde 2,1-aminomutase [Candidatus Saganbacteria bacterium]|nr:glutamate-1-semialdehyde 2,1-aminomutase [Candidatus Saganbacteria bacterium]
MRTKRSEELFKEAERYLPGGVDSPVRAFKSVGGSPLFITKGKGSKIFDVDGNKYIDCVGSWGPLILGHSHPKILSVVKKVLSDGTSFGAPCESEISLAKLIKEAFPSIELVRMVNSGTEAVMSAIRSARGYTKRDKIIKFEGCYHGHTDSMLVKAGSGLATFGQPNSLGITKGTAADTIVLPFNDLEAVEKALKEIGNDIAALIIEPIPGNMGVVLPRAGYLQGLRDLTTKYGIVLIFDEVITGFRAAFGGAQELYGIKADLTCLGKIIGGGFPVGAFGGEKEIMENLAPLGGVYQAGTLSGNPIAMAAGIEMLKQLKNKKIYKKLERSGQKLETGLKKILIESGEKYTINRVGSLLTLFFTEKPVVDYQSASKSDAGKFKKFFWSMLNNGIYLPPSQYEAWFLSLAHSDQDIAKVLAAVKISI